jgi:hypothetical protein
MMRGREKIPAFLKKNERSKNYQFDPAGFRPDISVDDATDDLKQHRQRRSGRLLACR